MDTKTTCTCPNPKLHQELAALSGRNTIDPSKCMKDTKTTCTCPNPKLHQELATASGRSTIDPSKCMKVLQEFKIPDANLEALRERLEKLSKKAMKLVGQPITLTVVKTFDVERTRYNFNTGKAEGTGIYDRFHTVTISGPRPKLNGWVFAAALDVVSIDGERAVLVRNAPGESIPAEIRNHTSGCDHCHTHRNRKTLYVLKRT